MKIRERLVRLDPENGRWQRSLSVSHSKLGDVALASRDFARARDCFTASLGVIERLATSDPANRGWQRDLALGHGRLGEVEVAAGKLAKARVHLTVDLTITKRLAASDPANGQWQRDLAVSHYRLGHLDEACDDVANAILQFERAEVILAKLVTRPNALPELADYLNQVRGELERLRGSGDEEGPPV